MLPRGIPTQVGPYQVLRPLGAGGMGMVFVVRDPQVDRPLALKLIKGHSSPTALQRFMREAEALARIQHRGVVRIHRVGQAPQGPFILQELIEGEPLSDVSERQIPPAEAAEIVRALANAVSAVHAQGILHRDLKPGNVILQPGNIPVLLDFGLAREVDAATLTKTGASLGTPTYMSPEQARGDSTLDATTDVYGLGVILYELLRGRPPFEGPGGAFILAKVIMQEPDWPSSEREGIPPELEAICRVAMAKDRNDRYPSAQALQEDLDRFLAHERTKAADWLAIARRGRALRITGGVLLGLALLSLLGALGGWLATRRPQAKATPPKPVAKTAARPPSPTEAQRGPLWNLKPTDTFRMTYGFDETDESSIFRFKMTIDVLVVEREQDLLRLSCTFQRALGGFSLQGSTAGQDYDSDRAVPQHPLASLGAAVGQQFTMWLDPATGRIAKFNGMNRIGHAIYKRARKAFGKGQGLGLTGTSMVLTGGTIGRYLRKAFSNKFAKVAFDTLVHMEGQGRRVDWRAAAAGAERSYQYQSDARSCGVPPISEAWKLHKTHRFSLEGKATYRDGRLVRAELNQQLVGLDKGRGLLPLPMSHPKSRSNWSVQLD